MQRDQLQLFVLVARYRHLSRAAVELGIAQPTASDRLRALEGEVGAPLVHRQGRGLALTRAGEAFLPYAERALEILREGEQAVWDERSGSTGRVIVAVTVTAGAYLFAPALVAFERANPQIEVQVRSAHSWDSPGLLLDEVVHLALLSGPVTHPMIETLQEFRAPLALIAAPGHPLASRGSMRRDELARQRLLLSYWGAAYQSFLADLRKVAGGESLSWLEASPVELVKGMVAAGAGVSLVPAIAIRREIEAGELVRLNLEDAAMPDWQIALVRKKRRSGSPSAEKLAATLAQVLPELLREKVPA
ncbi:MAG: LysR family transcriptional regulator [Anaerolineales bacterium]|jgi:DNA-binding transcriptional LysR family regulator